MFRSMDKQKKQKNKVTMKKWKILLPNLLAITSMPLISLSGCVKEAVEYKIVQFNTNGGQFISSMRVPVGEIMNKPADPISPVGLNFLGWYDDEGCSEGMEHDFSQPVVNDMTIYAKWSDPVLPDVDSVTLNKHETEIEQGKKETLFARVIPDKAIQDVTWKSNHPEYATVDETTGEVTAVAEGEAIITATSVVDQDKSDTCKVTVTETLPLPESITITPSELTLKEDGDSVTLFASITPTEAIQDVTWTSNNKSVVVDPKSGVIKPMSRGTAIITATADADTSVTGTCNVTVEPSKPAPEDIKLSQDELSLKIGDSPAILFATISPAEASQDITWTSDHEEVATVDEGGAFGAVVTAVSKGTAKITATSLLDDTVSASCNVTVTETPTEPWKVVFYNGGEEYKTELVQDGDRAIRPTDPEKPTPDVNFKGWCVDESCSELFDWTTPVYYDMDLYAGWTQKQVYSVGLLNPAEDGLTINETVAEAGENITLHINSSEYDMSDISVWNVFVGRQVIHDYEFLTADANNALLIIPGSEVTGNIQVGFDIGEGK